MIWINSISELEYNNTPLGVPCYCEQIVYPADLILQGQIPLNLASEPSLTVQVLSADGLTVYETATSYFEYYLFTYSGQSYFNLRLKSYSPAMCLYQCWILRVTVSFNGINYFDKYTQRYCQTDCCDIPRGITFNPEDEGQFQANLVAITPQIVVPTSECGKPLIRIQASFDCLDNQLLDYYGIPEGRTWGFTKIVNIVGRIAQRPREITRNISYNCNLQRSESFKPFLVESLSEKGIFPTWKMNELEAMFHAEQITISDFGLKYGEQAYQFQGGIICEQVYKCWEIFKLKTTVQSCTVRQTFGCNETCEDVGQNLTFLIPENTINTYYSENNQLIGDYSQLLDWYRGQNMVSSVEDVTGEYQNVYAAFLVSGTSYIPTYFYFNSISPRNRVYGVSNPVSPVISCAMPAIGTIAITDQVCATPAIGSILITDVAETEYEVFSHGDWTVLEGNVIYDGRVYKLNVTSINSTLSETSPLIYFNSEVIGLISPEAAPITPQSTIIDDLTYVVIDEYGRIIYSGYPTDYDESQLLVELNNIYYYGT